MFCMLVGKIATRLDVRAERKRRTSGGEGMTRLGAGLWATWSHKKHHLSPLSSSSEKNLCLQAVKKQLINRWRSEFSFCLQKAV